MSRTEFDLLNGDRLSVDRDGDDVVLSVSLYGKAASVALQPALATAISGALMTAASVTRLLRDAAADGGPEEASELTGDLASDLPILRDEAAGFAGRDPASAYWRGLSRGSALGFSIARPGPFARKVNQPMSFRLIDFWHACHAEERSRGSQGAPTELPATFVATVDEFLARDPDGVETRGFSVEIPSGLAEDGDRVRVTLASVTGTTTGGDQRDALVCPPVGRDRLRELLATATDEEDRAILRMALAQSDLVALVDRSKNILGLGLLAGDEAYLSCIRDRQRRAYPDSASSPSLPPEGGE